MDLHARYMMSIPGSSSLPTSPLATSSYKQLVSHRLYSVRGILPYQLVKLFLFFTHFSAPLFIISVFFLIYTSLLTHCFSSPLKVAGGVCMTSREYVDLCVSMWSWSQMQDLSEIFLVLSQERGTHTVCVF